MHPASVSSSRSKRNLASHRSRRRSTGSWWPWPRLAVKDNRPTNQTDIIQMNWEDHQPILIPRWVTVTSSQWLASASWSEPCAQYQGSVHNHNHEQWTSINHVAMLCPFFQVVIPFSNCCVVNSSNRGPIVVLLCHFLTHKSHCPRYQTNASCAVVKFHEASASAADSC